MYEIQRYVSSVLTRVFNCSFRRSFPKSLEFEKKFSTGGKTKTLPVEQLGSHRWSAHNRPNTRQQDQMYLCIFLHHFVQKYSRTQMLLDTFPRGLRPMTSGSVNLSAVVFDTFVTLCNPLVLYSSADVHNQSKLCMRLSLMQIIVLLTSLQFLSILYLTATSRFHLDYHSNQVDHHDEHCEYCRQHNRLLVSRQTGKWIVGIHQLLSLPNSFSSENCLTARLKITLKCHFLFYFSHLCDWIKPSSWAVTNRF